ncbi:MAG: tyrosine-type recombinase/integrase [Actinophytocola sp.]|nr:tyrosine-type recombinase/integrase [Actinophytocola sp.]
MAWVEQVGEHSYRVRYAVDGRVRSVSGFASRREANDYALDLESDRRRGRWIDPAAGRLTVGEWARRWLGTLDLDTRTVENYGHRIGRHIQPRWGVVPLRDITVSAVTIWRNELLGWLAPGTVRGVLTVLSMMLDDAVDERLIAANPVRRRRRRGRRHRGAPPREKIWATPEEVLRVADRATLLGGYGCGLLIVTAGWTGARWGELAGLHRDRVDVRRRRIRIDRDTGCLHEGAHALWLGPPKTQASAREILLPPFLVRLLRDYLATTDGEMVFTSPQGHWLRRSCFDRRVFRPAADGNAHLGNARVRTEPAIPGLTIHGLQHGHKTWMIADGIPEIAQAVRLGHHLDDRVAEIYSHVAPEVERRLLRALERRWKQAVKVVSREGVQTQTPWSQVT